MKSIIVLLRTPTRRVHASMCKPLPCKKEGRLDRNSRTSTITLRLLALPESYDDKAKDDDDNDDGEAEAFSLPPGVASACLSPTFTPAPTAFQCTVRVSIARAGLSLKDAPLPALPIAFVLRAVLAVPPTPPPPMPTA